MSTLTVGKWCGYCGKWVDDNGSFLPLHNPFLHHIHDCEMRRCEEIKKMRGKEKPDGT